MTDLTKLADALKNQRQCDADGTDCIVSRQAADEAASILRSAAAVDVAGLMAMSDTSIVLACDYLMMHKESAKAKAIEHRAALESALRLALAAREGFVMVPVEPTPDMLEAGAGTKYEKRARNVWRDMIAAAAPKGTP